MKKAILVFALVFLCIWVTEAKKKDKKKCRFKSCFRNGEFPTNRRGVKRYTSMFDNPTVDELYESLNLSTPYAIQNLAARDGMVPRIIELIPGRVYQGIFYALGWPVVIVTPADTLIVIDAPEGEAAGAACLADFRKQPGIGNKPIAAIIYTLYHADHTYGAEPFMEDGNNVSPPVVIAHSNMLREGENFDSFKGFKMRGTFRMFGTFIPYPYHIHDAAVRRLAIDGPHYIKYPPTDILYFEQEEDIVTRTIGGLIMQFYYVPGYTSDQMMVFFPQYQTLHAADVYYSAMPNLYSPRGEHPRSAMGWGKSCRRAAEIGAALMVVTHSAPVAGVEKVEQTLTTFADAIQYFHDQTIRLMIKDVPGDVIASQMELPYPLAQVFDLGGYGTPETSIKGIVDYYIGWFSGWVEDLLPVNRNERGSRLIAMMGKTTMQSEAAKAYNDGDYAWALELASYLWRNDKTDEIALDIRTETLKRMAELQGSPPARHYLLSALMEDWGLIENILPPEEFYINMHLDGVLRNMQYHLDSGRSENVTTELYVDLTDLNIIYHLTIRNSILLYEVVDSADPSVPTLSIKDTCDLEDENDTVCFRYLLATRMSTSSITASMVTNGSPSDVATFLGYFDLVDAQNGGYTNLINY